MTQKTDYLIIGNSAAGVSAAESIRRIDKKGKIDIFTSENYFNYSKPCIIYYVSGKLGIDNICFRRNDFYSKNNISLNLNSEIVGIDTIDKCVFTSEGKKMRFDKLLIASGGKPIIPEIKICSNKVLSESLKTGESIINDSNVKKAQNNIKQKSPKDKTTDKIINKNNSSIFNSMGINGNNENNLNKLFTEISGVFTLTTLSDAIALKHYIEDKKIDSATILGGGLIGLKAAEALLELGININIIELQDRILSASFDKTTSEIIRKRLEEVGGRIFTNSSIDEIYIGKENKITSFKLVSGKKFQCNLLIIAIGVKPNIEMLKNTDIKIENGIVVNNELKTSCDDIYAAGDVVVSYDILAEKLRNIAIWPLAVKQGSVAGINISGGKALYSGGFFMNSVEILGIPVISIGLSNLEENTLDDIEVYKEYNPDNNHYRKVIIKKGKIIGATVLGNIERAGIYTGLITNQIDVSSIKGNIVKEDFGLIQLPTDYRKHLVVGEGIEV